jgi:hypothetical protein
MMGTRSPSFGGGASSSAGNSCARCCCSRFGRIVYGLIFLVIYGSYILYYNTRVTKDIVFIRSDRSLGCGSAAPKAVVLMDSLQNEMLAKLGGTGHWFHFTEFLLPSLEDYINQVWDLSKDHEHLYIVFQESSSPTSIVGMGRILLSSIVSGGNFKKIIVGFANSITFANNSDTVAVLDTFQEIFSVDNDILHKSIQDLENEMSKNEGVRICSNIVYRHHWSRGQRFEWFDKSLRDFVAFRKAVGSVCGLQFDATLANSKEDHYSRAVTPGTIRNPVGIPDDMCDGHNRAFFRWNSDNSSTLMQPAPIIDSKFINRRIVLYQRDHSRVLTNAESVVKDIASLLHFGTKNASLVSPKALNALRGAETQPKIVLNDRGIGVVTTGQGSGSENANDWNVELIVHSPTRSPCEVIKEVSTATVLITPHGFQSLLLLFQPLESLLVEIQPHLYVKPTVYGYVEAGFRLNMGLPRSYLYDESVPNFWMRVAINILETIGLGSFCNEEYCIQYAACRYLSRLQEVSMSSDFVTRTAKFILRQYPS